MEERKVKIRVEGVYKIFGRHPEKARELIKQGVSKDDILEKTGQAVGVADASFDVYEGETLVIMGLSGSGKSTLVRCINRLIEPTYGTVTIDGVDITKMNEEELREVRRKKFGMVFQSFALFPHRTVIENAEFGLEIQGVPLEERRPKAQAALEQVGLGGWEEYYPENLSGGMKQRVGLARAMAIEPDVLLMDEAFSALDPLIRADMQDELLSLESQVHKTILFITHDLDEALKMGDRIVLMKDGRVVQIGTPEEILSNPANAYVAKFVENVDRSKVLTAEDVMVKARPVAFVKDGPRVALKAMTEAGHSGIYIVRQNYELVGYMSAEQAAEAVKRGDSWLDHIFTLDQVPTTLPDVPVRDLFGPLSDKSWPVAVVNEKNILKGVIVRGSVFAALSEGGSDE
ncbi:quaternary amine ABC transporter ATP-binding protein [Spirochaeta lutea]|uniref:Glycine/betaine ABC transporter ATP-binding protein n=1 Tax=Spirochaeta lutea TaxID=1480694 RepID=A0A098QST7_9SPIO|nr:glycine betaine/L-proline ABC transporter ATP-binding protein [Spirochaeta lutea]KGE70789.1 glycine/betaine ABC transporter ATP-binding protein [Spirochaeta lutea]